MDANPPRNIDDVRENGCGTGSIQPMFCPTEADPSEPGPVMAAINQVMLVVCSILLVVGSAGNAIAFAVHKRQSHVSSTYNYLAALALTNGIFLTFILTFWIMYTASGGSLDLRSIINCNLSHFLYHNSSQLSAWLIVCLAMERVFVTYFPLNAHVVCRINFSRYLILTITFGLIVINWLFLGGLTDTGMSLSSGAVVLDKCTGRTGWLTYYWRTIYRWIDAALYSFLPSVCMLTFNTLLLLKLYHTRKVTPGDNNPGGSREAEAAGEGGRDSGRTNPSTSQLRVIRGHLSLCVEPQESPVSPQQKRLAILVLFLSFSFIVLTLPTSIVGNIQYTRYHDTDPYFMLTVSILEVLAYCNHSINVVLYSLTSSKFRNEVRMLFTCEM